MSRKMADAEPDRLCVEHSSLPQEARAASPSTRPCRSWGLGARSIAELTLGDIVLTAEGYQPYLGSMHDVGRRRRP